jgi:cytosine deaminase
MGFGMIKNFPTYFDGLGVLSDRIEESGGFINAHSHLDRAYTVTGKDFEGTVEEHLFEKWKLVNKVKEESSEEDYSNRIFNACLKQIRDGVKACLTFIDVDSYSGDRAIKSAYNVKNILKDMYGFDLILASQTLEGILSKKNRDLFESNLEYFDVIGSLPKADGEENVEKHLEYMLGISKDLDKRLHVHVDQLNTSEENETELLARMCIKANYYDKVTAVHSISLAAHEKSYREKVYSLSKDAGLSFVTCPSAWIDHRRTEKMSVTHNSVTPIDEMIPRGLTVALGTDNIHDIYKPFSDGDMFFELRMLLESTHFYNISELTKIATTNGKKVLGLLD